MALDLDALEDLDSNNYGLDGEALTVIAPAPSHGGHDWQAGQKAMRTPAPARPRRTVPPPPPKRKVDPARLEEELLMLLL